VEGASVQFGNMPHSLGLNRAYVIMLVLSASVQSISCYCGLKHDMNETKKRTDSVSIIS
jgi:hypothetical protein